MQANNTKSNTKRKEALNLIQQVACSQIVKKSVHRLVERMGKTIDLFVKKGVDEKLLASASWVLPCCDAVMLTADQTDVVFNMTREISEAMRER